MKKHILTTAALSLAATLILTACGGSTKPASSAAPESTAPAAESSAAEQIIDAKSEDIDPKDMWDDLWGKNTYKHDQSSGCYTIRFMGDNSSHGGMVGTIGTTDGVGLCIDQFEPVGCKMEGISLDMMPTAEDIPVVMTEMIQSAVGGSYYGVAKLHDYGEISFTLDSVEGGHKVGNYDCAKYTGTLHVEGFNDRPKWDCYVVGYATYLKQNGYPIWNAVIDTTVDQVNHDRVEEWAFEQMNTLREF